MINVGKKLFVCIVLTCWYSNAGHGEPLTHNPLLKKRKMQGLLSNLSDQNSDKLEQRIQSNKNFTPQDLARELDALDNASKTDATAENAAKKNAATPAKNTQPKAQAAPSAAMPSAQESPLRPPMPQTVKIDENEIPAIEFHFENTDLQNLVSQIAEIFQVNFISDEAISPMAQTGKAIKGNKISFKTNKPLTHKQAWDLFLTFLDLAGVAVVPQADPKFYKIVSVDAAYRSALHSYIGVDPNLLPENDEIIRYVYFIENSSVEAIKGIVDALRSASAPFQILQESKAFILTDKAYNIKMLMQIVKELDKVTMPQTLAVLKLKRADALQVKELYDSISKSDDNMAQRLFTTRKSPTSLYFPENTRIFAEPRTNTLILLGSKDAIAKIEDFITRHIDVEVDKPYSPLNTYELRYADATTVAEIMNNVTQFGRNTEAGKSGGVRGVDKYLKNMSFTAEKDTNRLVIRGDHDDYIKVIDIIKKLDEPQPQVAIEALIITLDLNDQKGLGTQLRTKVPAFGPLPQINWQTSGFDASGVPQGVVTNQSGSGVQRLLGDLVNLATGALAGNTIVTFGMDQYGVWGIFNALESITNAQVISNPFLTATNKTPATISLGETKRVITANVIGAGTTENSFGDDKAELRLEITPQINNDGMIILTLNIRIDNFLNPLDPTSATKTIRQVTTKASVADKEVLAIGGLIQNTVNDHISKVPILGDIPIIGWLFKNRNKVVSKSNLLVLISTRVINPEKNDILKPFTDQHIKEYQNDIARMQPAADYHDPITKKFFMPRPSDTEHLMNDFLFKRHDQEAAAPLIPENKVLSRNAQKRQARKQKRLAREQQRLQQENSFAKQITPKNIYAPGKESQILVAKPPTTTTILANTKSKKSLTNILTNSAGAA